MNQILRKLHMWILSHRGCHQYVSYGWGKYYEKPWLFRIETNYCQKCNKATDKSKL